jgi:hypothetical protein
MKNQELSKSTLPLAILFGKSQQFEEPTTDRIIYNPLTQVTETLCMGVVGTKCLRSSQTAKKTHIGTNYDMKQKNEIDDQKSN